SWRPCLQRLPADIVCTGRAMCNPCPGSPRSTWRLSSRSAGTSSILRSCAGSGEPGRSATHALAIHVHRIPSDLAPEPTAYSSGSACAFGGGSPRALVRQAKLGVSCKVQVPAREGLTNHLYRVLHLCRRGTAERHR